MDVSHVIEQFWLSRTDEAFCALFEVVYPRLRRYFLLRGMEIAEAEDLSQNVMIVIHRHAGDVRDELLFQGWIFKVAKNELARYWRQRQTRERIAGMEPLSDLLSATLAAETAEDGNNNFSEWMSHLDAPERELLILRFVEGLSYEELALALGIPVGTVKWRLFNVKKKLAPIIFNSSTGRHRRVH